MSVLKKILPIDELLKTMRRFPISALCSIALFIFAALNIHGALDWGDEVTGRIVTALVYGFFWFGFAQLVTEGRALGALYAAILRYGVFAILLAFVVFSSGFTFIWMLSLLAPALLLGISVGPYLNSRDNLSFWFYNRQVWQGAAISILAGLLWGGGISAALGAIDYLFGVDVDGDFYSDVWMFAMVVFAPLYALSWVPEEFKYTEADCHAPAQLSFLLNWVLAPLVVIYMLILYAYFIKIAFAWELPRGQLSYMVTAFGGVGVLTYLAGWPLRENGGSLLRLVYKLFFPALFIPVAMQAMSIYLRLEQYGVTEQRYLIALSTVWFAGLAVAYTFRKPALKYITGSLGIMMVFAALGPLSAPNISERSQFGRLKASLVQHKILVEGQIQEAPEALPFEVRKSISSQLDFLRDRKKLERVNAWLPEEVSEEEDVKGEVDSSFEGQTSIYDITKLMGFEFVSHYQDEQNARSKRVNLRGENNNADAQRVEGFKYLLNNRYVNAGLKDKNGEPKAWEKSWDAEPKITARFEAGVLSIIVGGRAPVEFDVQKFAIDEAAKDPSRQAREMMIDKSSRGVRVKVTFNNIALLNEVDEPEPAEYKLQNFSFRALVDY